MKIRIMSFLAAALLLGLAPAASATHWVTLTFTSGCEGWEAAGTVQLRSGVASANVHYVVTLFEAGATAGLETQAGDVTIGGPAGTVVPFAGSGTWASELCGDYFATGTFVVSTLVPVESDTRNFVSPTFTCDCPDEEDICHYTQGYWKNHDWPIQQITLGGITYSRDQALDILKMKADGDMTIILAYQLIAAILNVANGASDDIQGAIDEANAYLMMYPLGSDPEDEAVRDALEELKNALEAYNEMGCPDDYYEDLDKSLDLPEQEAASWGTLKDAYR